MSIRIKLFLIMLFAFGLNLGLVLGYYRFFLSKEISRSYTQAQVELDEEAKQIASSLKNETEWEEKLIQTAKERGLVVILENEAGEVLFQSGYTEGYNIDFFGTGVVRRGDEAFLIKIIRSIPLDNIPMMGFMHNLMYAEVVIVLFILSMLTAAVYFNFIKAIMSVQEDMNNFRKGIKPVRTKRSDEIGWLKNKFVELTDSLDIEKQKQNNIIASISHDIKTPLTSVMGYTEQLRKGQLTPERQRKYIDIIYGKAQNIRDLINDFDEYLNYNLQNALKKTQISVGQLVEIIQEEYSYELQNMGVQFSVVCECNTATLWVDLPKIRRVFGNIIGNSIKHANCNNLEISVRCKNQGDFILFTVSDNGAGINPMDQEKIFEPLYSSESNRRVSGLGLSICKSIIDSHDGKIWAGNKPAGGFSIHFLLPATQ